MNRTMINVMKLLGGSLLVVGAEIVSGAITKGPKKELTNLLIEKLQKNN